ncbi:hypothetical protein BS47DRAFT_943453 [Hydnum rufescens UP504]|uniref:Uncharacterized protein n=1 Tax=Hydnum rufescens UP504 TaxID=1448309 RepID=A0A9P6DWF0_9AGAM|nr:hypothetical protein BS47DRAFT_943453 [Hydnum rufescens UP504]
MATPIAATITAIAATRCARRLAGLATSPAPSLNSKRGSSFQSPSGPPSYKSQTKDKDGYLSPDASFLSLQDDSIPVRPNRARLLPGRSEKQDIKVSDDHLQTQLPPRTTIVHFEQSGKMSELHGQDGADSLRKSSLASTQVDEKVSIEIVSKVTPLNAQESDYYKFPRTPISHSGASFGIDLERSHGTSAIGLPVDPKPTGSSVRLA